MAGMRFQSRPSAAVQPATPGRVLPLVTGAVLRPDADVRLDGYGHAWIAPTPLAPTTLAPLNDEQRLLEGLQGFARSAAPRRAAMLDAQPQGCGRDAALATFQRELEGGMPEQPLARPAAVAAPLGADAPDDDPCWDAALEACRRSGALGLERRLEEGLAGAVAIGLGLAEPGAWDDGRSTAGPGATLAAVERRRRELGASAHDVDALLGKNLLARAARSKSPGGAG